ncbi:tRNA methyltransferase [Dyadobacter luteus]|uniref:tRNA1(Val) (adenine(37)-N6)-methyltransferase n=1 Tax=Dyadobacter luteus TaxID=2259619 RepID=A0A3D8YBL7_9BACT|nr:methyltransferase [Dyadobacter luteus]REA61558.1 tRNA methyltransferase [Dyadobacter luteus]
MAKNSYFRFKQFTVHQGQSAMKVCTDACVLGAWADLGEAEHILDIGTGTGLLSLMAAQRNSNAEIHAVELDDDAFNQATENLQESIFAERIQVFHQSIQSYEPNKKYDCIITNPPFFQSDLLSPDQQKNKAHHATSLTFDELLTAIDRLLTDEGKFHILLPVDEAGVFLQKALVDGWFLADSLILQHNSSKKPFRHIMTFSRKYISDSQIVNSVLHIYNTQENTYTDAFKDLLKDFYLIF